MTYWAIYQDNLSKNSNDGEAIAAAFAKYSSVKMIIDWEHYRSIYQYSQKTVDTAFEKYQDLLFLFGFPVDLLKYFPQNTIILHNPNDNFFAMVALIHQTHEKKSKNHCVITYRR